MAHLSWSSEGRRKTLSPIPTNAWGRWKRRPCDRKSGKAIPNHRQLQNSREQALCAARAAQQIQPH